jgi:hypothetical protein
MEVKCLEVRDANTFCPVICVRPVAENEAQRYLLRRDGYRADDAERCIIYILPQCHGVSYDPYSWNDGTHHAAHLWIEKHWAEIKDGDVVDVEFIRGKSAAPRLSERSIA